MVHSVSPRVLLARETQSRSSDSSVFGSGSITRCCCLRLTNRWRLQINSASTLSGISLCWLHRSVVSEREGEMKRCPACETLIGRASTVLPHEKLLCSGSGVFGSPKAPITRYVLYRCTSCGCWMKQNTSHGTPAGRWCACESRVPIQQVPERTPPDHGLTRAVFASVQGRPR
jgi:hypothetical protein